MSCCGSGGVLVSSYLKLSAVPSIRSVTWYSETVVSASRSTNGLILSGSAKSSVPRCTL